MLQKAFDEGVSPNSRVSVYGAGKGPLLLAMLLSRKQEKDVIETALKAGADPNLLSGVEKARLSEYNIGAGPAKGSRTWPAASEKTNPRDFQGTVRPTVRPVVEPQPGNITTIQIKVGVNQRFSLFLKQQSLILQSPIKSLSITPDLKKYQGFYYRTPTCLISTKQRLIKWDLRTPFVVDKGKDNLYIVDVRILASSRPIITVHPKQDKSIQPRNVSLRWTENSINLTDNEIGAAAFIIELSFSNQKPDLTKKTSYVSKHKLITN